MGEVTWVRWDDDRDKFVRDAELDDLDRRARDLDPAAYQAASDRAMAASFRAIDGQTASASRIFYETLRTELRQLLRVQ